MAKINLIDRVIGYVSPQNGLRRVMNRELLTRAYEGANIADGWRPRRSGASARADHLADGRELRHRARSLVQNVPYITQAVNAVIAARVGAGIVPVWGSPVLKEHWDRWVPVADYDGLLDFYGLQAKAEMARDVDGAVLIRKRIGRNGAAAPLQLQLLEIDYLDTQLNRVERDEVEIIGGIEYRKGKRSAYWVFDRHPGDVGLWTVGRSGSSKRVPANEIIHLFAPRRPGLQDGITRLAPVISKVRDMHTYGDSELQRKQLESRLGVIAEFGQSVEPAPIADKMKNDDGSINLGDLAGGGIVGLPPGMTNPVFIEPKPVPGFGEYMKAGWKEVAAGYGCPYELMTGDMTEVNFSSSRVRTNQFRREVEMEQWHITIPMLCAPVAQWWLQALDLVADVPSGATAPAWSTPKWASPNPMQDVASELAAIKGGLASISGTIRSHGDDPEVTFTELENDLKRLNKTGLLPLLAALWGASNPLDLVAKVGEK